MLLSAKNVYFPIMKVHVIKISRKISKISEDVPNVACSSRKLKVAITWPVDVGMNFAIFVKKIGKAEVIILCVLWAKKEIEGCFIWPNLIG